MKRERNNVHLQVRGLENGDGTNFINLPLGFQLGQGSTWIVSEGAGAVGVPVGLWAGNSGNFTLPFAPAQPYYFYITYQTENAWPSTLPGTPV